ncbi:sex peptide receptor-like [Brachionus plicatilis]|uniref:Sex peptide receptor-like n=1 Tax=Brachionus plicatilis TaxID=10195 RepID=A0A3M7Q8E6_BRAPC|nr:sex peptide receptor-like [Brachionus plicatilis]
MLNQNFIIQLYFYCSVIIVPIGSVFNIVTIIIFLRKRFRHTNYGYISCVIAFFNTIALIWNFVFYKYFKLTGTDLSIFSSWSCYLFRYCGRMSQQFPVYIQVLLTLTKYLDISSPTSKINFALKKRIYINVAIFGVLISIICLNLPSSFKYLKKEILIDKFNRTRSSSVCTINRINELLSNISSALLRAIIPFIIITLLNILMVKKLMDSKRRMCFKKNLRKEIQFSFGLCLINSSFLILNFPLATTYVLTSIVYKIQHLSQEKEDQIYLVHLICNAISYLYYGPLTKKFKVGSDDQAKLAKQINLPADEMFKNKIGQTVPKKTLKKRYIDPYTITLLNLYSVYG